MCIRDSVGLAQPLPADEPDDHVLVEVVEGALRRQQIRDARAVLVEFVGLLLGALVLLVAVPAEGVHQPSEVGTGRVRVGLPVLLLVAPCLVPDRPAAPLVPGVLLLEGRLHVVVAPAGRRQTAQLPLDAGDLGRLLGHPGRALRVAGAMVQHAEEAEPGDGFVAVRDAPDDAFGEEGVHGLEQLLDGGARREPVGHRYGRALRLAAQVGQQPLHVRDAFTERLFDVLAAARQRFGFGYVQLPAFPQLFEVGVGEQLPDHRHRLVAQGRPRLLHEVGDGQPQQPPGHQVGQLVHRRGHGGDQAGGDALPADAGRGEGAALHAPVDEARGEGLVVVVGGRLAAPGAAVAQLGADQRHHQGDDGAAQVVRADAGGRAEQERRRQDAGAQPDRRGARVADADAELLVEVADLVALRRRVLRVHQPEQVDQCSGGVEFRLASAAGGGGERRRHDDQRVDLHAVEAAQLEGVVDQVQVVQEDPGAGAAGHREGDEHVAAVDLAAAEFAQFARRLGDGVDRLEQRFQDRGEAVPERGEQGGPSHGGQLARAGVQRGDLRLVDAGRQPFGDLVAQHRPQHLGHFGGGVEVRQQVVGGPGRTGVGGPQGRVHVELREPLQVALAVVRVHELEAVGQLERGVAALPAERHAVRAAQFGAQSAFQFGTDQAAGAAQADEEHRLEDLHGFLPASRPGRPQVRARYVRGVRVTGTR